MRIHRGRWAAPLLACTLAVAAPACGDEQGSGVTPAQCREDWESQRQTMGENGNPASPPSALAGRYDAMAAEAARLAMSAGAGDCPQRLDTFERQLDAFYQLAFESNEVDMRQRLARAEQDLKHAIATRDYDPLPRELAAAFAVLRGSAPRAHDDLTPILAEAAAIELTDAAVAQAAADLAAAAETSAAYQRCERALVRIGSYELHEE
jgi:hypothetical protein